eukprot:2535801-Pyramimonas_sp.AAC.1
MPNLPIAQVVSEQSDSIQAVMDLGRSLSGWARALELVTCARKRLRVLGGPPWRPRPRTGPPLADRRARFWQSLASQL